MNSMSKSRLSTSILALLIISAVAAASLTGCATIGFGSGKAPTKIAVLHTNDIHSNLFPWSLRTDSGELVEVGGLARIATIVEETRRGNCPVLLLNSGDSFYPNSLSKWHGSPEIGALNMTGYDCATLGNHEFDLGDDYLGQVLDIAKFPFVCANLEVEASPPLAGKLVNYAIKNIGGCSVGIFGLITPDLDTIASPSDNIVIDRDLAGLTGALVAYLDPRTDLIFALTHIGLPMDIKLAESVSGIDAIFGGHSHDAIHEAVEVTNPAGGRTLVLQSGCYGRYVGKLELTSALDAIDSYEWTLLEVNSEIKENEPVASYLNAFQEVREDPIGIIESELKISGDAIRGQDSTIGTLVCDAIAEE
ncbi:MAG: metallophosphatase, partial [Candidatus Coatesbacteria bacterium]|nr:metallophosphatase [Candidatus Coatesbacteria bacterium]